MRLLNLDHLSLVFDENMNTTSTDVLSTKNFISTDVTTSMSPVSNLTVCGAIIDPAVGIAPGLTDQTKSQSWEIALIVVYFVIGALSIIGNIIIILSIALVKTLRKSTNFFIASLALSDLLIGVGITLDSALYPFWGQLCHNAYQLCLGLTTINNIAMAVSPLNLMAISYDRYKYITSPLHYHLDMGNTKVWIMIIVAWIYSFMIGLIPIFPGDLANVSRQSSIHKSCLVYKIYPKLYLFFLIYGHLYVSFAITCVFYIQIFKKAIQQNRNIRKLSLTSQLEKISRRKAFLKSTAWRVTKMSAIVIVSVFILWCPHTTLITYLILCDDCKVHYAVYALTYILFYLNCCNNMFIYAWRSPEYRKAFKYVINCGRK